jgi:predicted ABC-type ATPase
VIPQLWVFAGPNGAGKSTLVDRYMADDFLINPYNIARELDPGLAKDSEFCARAV